MQGEGLPERLRRIVGPEIGADFDASDPLQVDRVARTLLGHFVETHDPATFTLLVEVAGPLLEEASELVARDVGLAADPRELVASFFADTFATGGAGSTGVHYLQRATLWMQEQAESWVRDLALARVPHDGDAVVVEIKVDGSEARIPVTSESDVFMKRMSIAFHGLDRDQRVVLRAADIQGLSVEEIASKSGIPVAEARERILSARARLDDALSRLEEDQP